MKRFFFGITTLFLLLGCATVPKESLNTYLSQGTWEEGLKAFATYPTEGQNAFETGFIMTLRVIEKLFQDLDRYGVGRSREAQSITGGPFPWSSTKSPEVINYEKFIQIFVDARDRLKLASAVLEKGGAGDWKVKVNTGLIILDFNGDGKRTPEENLGSVFRWASRVENLQEDQIKDFYLAHDPGDSLWLAGYTRLIEGALDMILDYDLKPIWSSVAHYVFPNVEDANKNDFNLFSKTFFIKMNNKQSGEAARQAFIKVTELSPLSWEKILHEKDDDHEWLTAPGQKSVFGMDVTQERVNEWLVFMSVWKDLLEGKKLIPLEEPIGLNLKTFFQNLPDLSSDMEVQFPKAYGEVVRSKDQLIEDPENLEKYLFGDNMLFALWFN